MKLSPASVYPLGIAHFTTIGIEPVAFVEMAARIGYAKVGLRLHPAFPGSPYYTIAPGSAVMRTMKQTLAATGVSVFDVEFVVIDKDFKPQSLAPLFEQAGELGARRLAVCGDDEDAVRLTANIAALAAMAKPVGMMVDLENMPWRKVASFAQALSIVRATGAENVGALVDALHFIRGGGAPSEVAAAGRYVGSFQLCDTTGPRPPTHEALIAEARSGRKLPGEGDLPLAALLGAMPDGCTLSVEVPLTSDDAEVHARRVFDAAQRVIGNYANAAVLA